MAKHGRNCLHCPKTTDLRPYGPGGALICFACAMQTPERESEARAQFATQTNAAALASDIVAIGDDAGPRPVGGRRQ